MKAIVAALSTRSSSVGFELKFSYYHIKIKFPKIK